MRRVWALSSLLVVLLAAGCGRGEMMEIENRSIVLGISIDAGEEEEFKVSMQLPFLQGGQQSQGGGDSPDTSYEVFTDEGSTIWDALSKLEKQTPTALFLGHMKLVAISEEVANRGLEATLDFLRRHTETGNKSILLIVKGDEARRFLTSNPPLVPLPSLYINRYFFSNQKFDRFEDIQLYKYLRDSQAISQTAMVPMVKVTENRLFLEEVAVVKNHKMVYTFLEEELFFSRLLKHTRAELFPYSMSFKHDNETIDISLMKVLLKQKISFQISAPQESETPSLDIRFDIKGDGQLIEWATPEVPFNLEMVDRIEHELSKKLAEEIQQLISKLQEENIDPWLIGQRFRGYDRKTFKKMNWEKDGWRNAEVHVKVDFKLRNTGQVGIYDKMHINDV